MDAEDEEGKASNDVDAVAGDFPFESHEENDSDSDTSISDCDEEEFMTGVYKAPDAILESEMRILSKKIASFVTFSGFGPSEGTMKTFSNIESSEFASTIRSIQTYLPDLRNFHGFSKSGTSTSARAFGFHANASIQKDGSAVLKFVEQIEAIQKFIDESILSLDKIMERRFLNRCEIKTHVDKGNVNGDVLRAGFQDLEKLISSIRYCNDASTVVKLMKINCHGILGLSLCMSDLVPQLTSAPILNDFMAAYGEIQAHGFSQWSGKNSLNKNFIAPRLQQTFRRALFSPANKYLLQCSEQIRNITAEEKHLPYTVYRDLLGLLGRLDSYTSIELVNM